MRKNSKNHTVYNIEFMVFTEDEFTKKDFEHGFLDWFINKVKTDYKSYGLSISKYASQETLETTFTTRSEYVFKMLSNDFQIYRDALSNRYVKRYGMIKGFSINERIVTDY